MKEILSTIFREIEHDIGTRELNKIVCNSLLESIGDYQIKNVDQFKENLKKIICDIENTQPKFAIIIEHCHRLLDYLSKILPRDSTRIDAKNLKNKLLAFGKELTKETACGTRQILHNALKELDVRDKRILIFDHSHTVQDVLTNFKKQGMNFKVVVGEQDIEKTEENIIALHQAEIPFEVVPGYMLSHYEEEVDMLFFGALTLKSTFDFVTDTGSSAIISEFHLRKKPIYMFISSAKFSLWKSQKKTDIFSHPHLRRHSKKGIEYQRLKFSHDRVPLEFFTKIITEEGVFTPHEVKKLFQKKLTAKKKIKLSPP